MDLNIIVQINSVRVNDVSRTVRLVRELGYRTVALNTIIGAECFTKEGIQTLKLPEEVKSEGVDHSFQVFSRLTAMAVDEKQCYQLIKSPVVRKFDILALEPCNEKVFAHVCSNVEFDILCVDLCSLHFPLKRELLKQARARGLYFELQYSQLFGDDRTLAIANGRNLVSAGCKRNIIVSSGATKYMQVRAPDCVINICSLFGLDKEHSKAAVLKNGLTVLKQARMRTKTGKAVVSVEDMHKVNVNDTMLTEACTLNSSVKDISTSIDAATSNSSDVKTNREETYEAPPKKAKRESDNDQD